MIHALDILSRQVHNGRLNDFAVLYVLSSRVHLIAAIFSNVWPSAASKANKLHSKCDYQTIRFTQRYVQRPWIYFIVRSDKLPHVDVSLNGVATQGELACCSRAHATCC